MIRDLASPALEPAPAAAGRSAPSGIITLKRLHLQPVPRAFRDHGERAVDAADSAFAAGAALFAMDEIVRKNPPWLGALRMRQALAAAAAASRLLRLREDEAALRDAHHLTRPAADPGPAGRLHRAWREFSARPTPLGRVTVGRFAEELGLPPPASILPRAPEPGSPVGAAAAVAAAIARAAAGAAGSSRPLPSEAEILGLMAADLALADRLGWAAPMPLLATAMFSPTLRCGPEGRRVRPGDAAWPALCHRAFAHAALAAQARAMELDRRAEKLLAAAGRVRTRGGQAGVAALLADDATTATALDPKLGSGRAARRFLDRLVALDGLRELTGRPTFRLYGL